MHSETRNCQNCKKDFVIGPEDFDFYEKIDVPAPTWCPRCRMIRRMAFRNERALYNRPCDLCEKPTISMYSPDKPLKSYCQECFNSDKWNPMDFSRDYNFARNFFFQWNELKKEIPQLALFQENSVNSPWVNYELDDKNCYLSVGGHENEDSAYNQYALRCKDSFDCFWTIDGQFVYENTLAEKCYKTFYSTLVFECRDAYFSFDCRNCSNIIGCTGLRHKQYHIFNKPVSKEEFEKFLQENLYSRENVNQLYQKSKDFWRSRPQRAAFIDKSVNSTGNLLKECKNCVECWMTEKVEDSKYHIFSLECQNAYDIFSIWKGELSVDSTAGFKVNNIKFSIGILESTDIEYSYWLKNCQNCFGCFNLRNKQYCILNKQYSKEEYEVLVSKIRSHMNESSYKDKLGRVYRYGEFFPIDLSPFGYNETVANEYFPKTKQEVEQDGFKFSAFEAEKKRSTPNYKLPDNIKDVDDDILKAIFADVKTSKSYRIIPMELEFYRRFSLPIPESAPFERHRKRLRFIADHLQLYNRKCGRCAKEIQSVYTNKEFPNVYCDQCYQAEVV